MAYQAAPRYHVSDVQFPEDEDVPDEEPLASGLPISKVRYWTAASAALLFVVGMLFAARYALSHSRTAFRKDVNSLQTVGFEAQGPLTCMACVAQGRSWQMGMCNPSKECLMMDQACYENAVGCKQWQEQAEADKTCSTQTDCTSCVAANRLCLWSGDAGCFMGADYWGPEHLVVRHGEICPAAPKTADISTTVEAKHGSSSEGFLQTSREPLAKCLACVEMGKSWQGGECSSECMMAELAASKMLQVAGGGNKNRKLPQNAQLQLGASSGKSKPMLTSRAAPRRTAQAALQAIGFASGVATQAVSWVLVIGGPEHLVVKHGEICPAAAKTTDISTTAEAKHGSSSKGFLKTSREPLAKCLACIEMGKSWQGGECSSECMMADVGCFQDASGCRRWKQEHEVAAKCAAQRDCSSCLGSDRLCTWVRDSGCSMRSSFWVEGPSMFVNGEKCLEEKATPLANTEVMKELTLSEEHMRVPVAGS
eukprot:CAMPEP_0172928200 /NCGR_PEP_ID=MMETSP1075-20121228/217850_1 /TAXON_ID=2916 /ORGANISM="Ceratium fusus, Strain PA161109" /LENGTH=480 /DNA_ID=CAMNT_0013789479 /DNA_START=65 /DNA_END=1507 /DNA_ORIENTATION=+